MKKLLLFLLFLLLVILTIFCWKYCCKPPTVIKDQTIAPHVKTQLIVNFENVPTAVQMAHFTSEMARLNIRIEKVCPCSPKLILLSSTIGVEINPDGDIKPPIKEDGGSKSGVSRNYILDSMRVDTVNRDFIDRNSQPSLSKGQVVMSIIDSGVDFANAPLNLYLHKNPTGSKCCGTTYLDGKYGLNMLDLITPVSEPVDKNGHGTFINGIIAGKAVVKSSSGAILATTDGNEGITIKQVNVSFVGGGTSQGNLFDGLCGIHYSVSKKAKVINASWGLETFGSNINEMQVFIPTLTEMIANDVLLVASAGNHAINFNTDAQLRLAWPASFSKSRPFNGTLFKSADNVIAVGAWDLSSNNIASFSNRGTNVVEIYAWGENVLSTALNSGLYAGSRIDQGTSFAAPFVARTAAILRGLKPNLTAGKIKETLILNAEPRPIPGSSSLQIGLLKQSQAVSNLPPF